MPVLTDEDVGIAPKVLSDADVGLSLSDEDVGLTPIETRKAALTATAENDFLRAEQAKLREADAGSTMAKVLGVAEKIVAPIAEFIHLPERVLELPEQLAATLGQPTPYTAKAPLVTPEAAKAVVEAVTPGGAASEGSAGKAAQEFVAEMASGMTTPAMVGALLTGTKAPVPVGRYFQGEMLAQVPASVAAIADAETGKEQTKAALGLAANVAFPALIEKHITPKAVVAERAKDVGPATAAVLEQTAGQKALDKLTTEVKVEQAQPPIVPRGNILEAPKPEVEAPATPEPDPVGMGAATPAEFELKPQNATGIKNATVDQERAKRGLPPAMEPARQEFGTVWDEAMAKIDADNGYTNRLLDELRKEPRPARPIENAVLTHRQVELQNEYSKAMRDLTQAIDDGRLEDAASERVRVDGLREQLWDFYEITKKVGTEQGRGLNIRKLMVFEDFTLAKMELEKRAAKGGEQLTEAERAEVVRANTEIERTTKALEEHAAGAEERVRQRETERTVAEIKASKEPVEPIEEITGKLKEKFMAGENEAITSLVQKLARYFVSQGVKERGALVEAVHSVIKDIDPTLTVRDTMDAISGYGRFRRLSKDDISVQLRDLKGQMQQVAKLEDMQANRPPLKTGTERRAPSDEERRLIRQVNEAKNKFQIPITDEATQLKSSLDTLKTRLRNQAADFEARLKAKDFEKKPKRFIQMDEAAQKLHFEATQAKAKWVRALIEDQRARRTALERVGGAVADTADLSRALMTTADLSAMLRQGGFFIGRPILMGRATKSMFKALRSERGQHAVDLEIMSRPNYSLYTRSKLYLSEHGLKLSRMEEAYASRWAEKIPIIRGFQRAYPTFLNRLRADAFDAMIKGVERTPENYSAVANLINVATGRGSIQGMEAALTNLNRVFFAPRWVTSRFQLLTGQPLWGKAGRAASRQTKIAIAKEYARYLTALGVIYGLWHMAGGEPVETDPRSSDFGKFKVGDTRIDPLSGLQQSTVFLAKTVTGEKKQLSGKVVPLHGDTLRFGQDDYADELFTFLRTKLAPIPASVIDLRTGTDVVKKPVTLLPEEATVEGVMKSEVAQLLTPITFHEIYKVMRDQGVPEGTIISLLAIFGAGVQTYD